MCPIKFEMTGRMVRLGQGIFVACDLRNYCSDLGIEFEVAVLSKKSQNTTKVDCPEKVFEVQVQYIAAVSVHSGVGDDRPTPLKSVGNLSAIRLLCFNAIETVAQKVGEPILYPFQALNRCLDVLKPPLDLGMSKER